MSDLITAEKLEEARETIAGVQSAVFQELSTRDISNMGGVVEAFHGFSPDNPEDSAVERALGENVKRMGLDPEELEKWALEFAHRAVATSQLMGVDLLTHTMLCIIRSVTVGVQASLQRVEDAN